MSDVEFASLRATREVLHQVAAHVLARRRFSVTGRCGLRASPGGFATPAFGDGPEIVRVAAGCVVREVAGSAAYMPIAGATLAALASFAGADLAAAFACGDDLPDIADPDQPLSLDLAHARRLADWYSLGCIALDWVLATQGPPEPATVQIWPEHFDAGTSVRLPNGERVNLGFSPGDGFEPEPYAYVGPWGDQRHGDPAFWNAPFGAVLRDGDLPPGSVRLEACVKFLEAGLANMSAP